MQPKDAHHLVGGDDAGKESPLRPHLAQGDPHADGGVDGQIGGEEDHKVAIEAGVSLAEQPQNGQVVAAKVFKVGVAPVPLQVQAQVAEGLLHLEVEDVEEGDARGDDEDVGVCTVEEEEGKGEGVQVEGGQMEEG